MSDRAPVKITCPEINKFQGKLDLIQKYVDQLQEGSEDRGLYTSIGNLLAELRASAEVLRAGNIALRSYGFQEQAKVDALREVIDTINNISTLPYERKANR